MDVDIDKPAVRLQDGDVYEAELILGADGERSVCRETLLDRDDPLSSTGNLVYRFTVETSDVRPQQNLIDLVDPPNVNLWMGPGSHAVSYVIKKDGLLNVALTIRQGTHDHVQHGAQRAITEELQETFKDWDVRFGALLKFAQECSKWSPLQSEEIDTWTHPRGRFALIGDSAHAMMPCLAQGASQCFEDAAVLGTLFGLIKNPRQIDDVLWLYERLRKPRAMEVRRRSGRELRVFSLPDGPEQQERDDQLLRDMPSHGYPIALMDPAFQQWLWAYNANDEAAKAWEEFLSQA